MAIPLSRMIVLWDKNERMQITRLIVVAIDQQTAEMSDLPGSAGACDEGWMSGSDPIATPTGLFLFLSTFYGFDNRDTAVLAVREFGKVEGQSAWTDARLSRFGMKARPRANATVAGRT